jgi:cupin domain
VLKVRNRVAPGGGPPMHTHLRQSEELTVEEGTIAWEIAGDPTEHRAGPGETVSFEPGVSHRFWNAGEDTLVCEGGIWPPDNIEYFLTQIYESTARNGGKRPGLFDSAFLTRHFRSEFRMDEIPAIATKVVIPIVARVGRLLGRDKRFANAPASVS